MHLVSLQPHCASYEVLAHWLAYSFETNMLGEFCP